MNAIADAVTDALGGEDLQHRTARCDKHGQYAVLDVPRGVPGAPACPQCVLEENQERARRDVVERAEAQKRERAAQRRADLEQRLSRSLIPERYRDCSLVNFPAPSGMTAEQAESHRVVLAACRTYVNTWPQQRKRGTGMVFTGPNGRGKSGLACGVANTIMRDYHATALFVTARGVVRHLCDTWGRKGRTEQEALDDLVGVDLLIVDDVGAQIGTEIEMLMLFEALNARYAERRPTAIVANLPVNDYEHEGTKRPGLRTFLGGRIWSRVEDDGTQILRCTWTTLRGRSGA